MSAEDIEEFVTVTITKTAMDLIECPECGIGNLSEPGVWVTLDFEHPCHCGECHKESPHRQWRVIKYAP